MEELNPPFRQEGEKRWKKMKTNKDEVKKVVLPMYIPGCQPDRRCCAYGDDCPGKMQYFPQTNKYVFGGCGC